MTVERSFGLPVGRVLSLVRFAVRGGFTGSVGAGGLVSVPVGVSYDSDLAQVERVTVETAKEVLARVDNNPYADPAVRFTNFGDSSIDFNVVLPSSRFDHQGVIKHEFIKALTERYRTEGIDIPYPIRSIIQEQENPDPEEHAQEHRS